MGYNVRGAMVPDLIFREEAGVLKSRRQQRWYETLAGLAVIVMAMGSLAGCLNTVTSVGHAMVNAGTTTQEDRSLYRIAADYAIKSEITHTYLDEAMSLDINTDVYAGRVLLTGAVTNADAKRKAEEIARRVKDVREIINEIQVTPDGSISASIHDLLIENELQLFLLMEKGVSSIDYRWRSVNSVVYFIGFAASREELDKVLNLAHDLKAVKKVVSHIRSPESMAPLTTGR
jgi:osmotically-inducible protein OsmY